ncbi:MAG TPA: TetR/AcrR family transcriptional regulator [Acidobacteriaceae bacterium]|nr:TetR/AcrR family transcriptional regulator [Acidobacteriaceae bacterium]
MSEVRKYLRSERTRQRILKAAIAEFSERGLAGARIGSIGVTARVNKALLYYYFHDKEALYAAALEEVAGKVAENALAVLEMDCSAGERMLRFALLHFDRVVGQRAFQSLMQQEMVRFHEGRGGAIHILARKAFGPMFVHVQAVAREGIESAELCNVDWMQMVYAALGANVFYMLSAPMVRLFSGTDPLEPAAIATRRTAAIEFLGNAIFVDRRRGARLAKKVLAAIPMPDGALREKKTA